MDYKELLEDTIELSKNILIISGNLDVIEDGSIFDKLYYYTILGNDNESMVKEALEEEFTRLDKTGEWYFDAVLRYQPGDYDEYDRATMPGYMEVKYINFEFIQSFKERDREIILSDLFEDFFK